MSDYVLDASALLAFLHNEPGAAIVAPTLTRALINAVNFAEVATKLAEGGADARAVLGALTATTGLIVDPFTEALAYEAGILRPTTRQYGLSLGDRACLAAGRLLGLPILTSDQQWRLLPSATIGVTLVLIR